MAQRSVVVKRYLKGVLSFFPGLRPLFQEKTGGTDSARYCYAVWLRHLVMARESLLNDNPRIVAELGPGDSIGTGLAALLTGAEKYYAFDVCDYRTTSKNVEIFEQLVRLFSHRTAIPDANEFPRLIPQLASYKFPSELLPENRMAHSLRAERLERIRHAMNDMSGHNSLIQYRAPWSHTQVIEPETVDMVYSQAVLEHVDNLKETYRAMYAWLKPGGYVSHVISFDSHGMHDTWNGHWTYSTWQWRLIRGNLPWLLNRQPCSVHLRLLEEAGFIPVRVLRSKAPSAITRSNLAKEFRDLTDEDLTTRSVFLQYKKP